MSCRGTCGRRRMPCLAIQFASSSSWNDTFWHNERFDHLLNAQLAETDPTIRHEMLCEMQGLVNSGSGMVIPGPHQHSGWRQRQGSRHSKCTCRVSWRLRICRVRLVGRVISADNLLPACASFPVQAAGRIAIVRITTHSPPFDAVIDHVDRGRAPPDGRRRNDDDRRVGHDLYRNERPSRRCGQHYPGTDGHPGVPGGTALKARTRSAGVYPVLHVAGRHGDGRSRHFQGRSRGCHHWHTHFELIAPRIVNTLRTVEHRGTDRRAAVLDPGLLAQCILGLALTKSSRFPRSA